MSAARPLDPADIDALMAPLGPFETSPAIAVAVSGGADSMALALLLHDWARRHGGRAVALTVDHGLRPQAGEEAARVGRWLAARGMAHHVLRWEGPKPAADVQAAARAARHRLLREWCAANGVLHLALAHHREDQAETLLLRLARGSGVEGLSAMAPVTEAREVRLLRPLLRVPRARLRATLRAEGQDWIEDPSNQHPGFSRSRLRALMPALAAEGMTAERLAATAGRLARARAALEADAAQALARGVRLHPAGFVRLDARLLAGLPPEVGLRMLARVLATVASADYPPRHERLERLHAALLAGGGRARTLAGCVVVPGTDEHLVCREPASVAPPVPVTAGEAAAWDGRFVAAVTGPAGARGTLGALGEEGWREIVAAAPALRRTPIPYRARLSLPALRDSAGVSAVAFLGYNRGERGALAFSRPVFRPARPLGGAAFALFAGAEKLS